MNRYDDNFADDLSQPATQQQARPGWLKRNWLWFVPMIILLPLFCCCGGPMALVWFGIGKALDMPPYKDSIALAEQNAEVQTELGTPIDAPEGFMDLVTMMQNGGQFNIEQVGSQIRFDAQAPISGPNGSGTLWIEAESIDGVNWTYTIQEVQLPDGTVIDLLPAGTGGGTDADTDESSDAAVDAIERSLEERGLTIPDQE